MQGIVRVNHTEFHFEFAVAVRVNRGGDCSGEKLAVIRVNEFGDGFGDIERVAFTQSIKGENPRIHLGPVILRIPEKSSHLRRVEREPQLILRFAQGLFGSCALDAVEDAVGHICNELGFVGPPVARGRSEGRDEARPRAVLQNRNGHKRPHADGAVSLGIHSRVGVGVADNDGLARAGGEQEL